VYAIAPLSIFSWGLGKHDLQFSSDNNFISIAIQKRAMYMLLNEFHTPNQFNASEEKNIHCKTRQHVPRRLFYLSDMFPASHGDLQ